MHAKGHSTAPFFVRISKSIFCHPAVGVPIKLLHEGEGHGVTVEMKNGEIYRGHLNEAEDTMNCFMTAGEIPLHNAYPLRTIPIPISGHKIVN